MTFGLVFCVVAAFAVLVAVAIPRLKDDEELHADPVVHQARAAAGRVKGAAEKARDVAEAAAGKVADSASTITAGSRTRR